MVEFLGEVVIDQKDVPDFLEFTKVDWAMYFIEHYGQFEMPYHKAWVLDQVAHILNDSPIIIRKATWSDGTVEYRPIVGEPSDKYIQWLHDMEGEIMGEYDYDKGLAP